MVNVFYTRTQNHSTVIDAKQNKRIKANTIDNSLAVAIVMAICKLFNIGHRATNTGCS